ncbi:flagellin [bacterium]|nr:flagellin [bacterium]
MSFRTNHNISAINAKRILSRNDFEMSRSLERLSSGLKINTAGDDPAGLVISENMRAQITGLNQAIENSELAVTMVQTAEGALTEVHALLNSMRELALHAANEGAVSSADLAADQAEIENALSTLTQIAENTQYATKKLLNGTGGTTGTIITGDAEFMGANELTESGEYTVDVVTPAEKATISNGATASVMLTTDEMLTVVNNTTGMTVTVDLAAGDNAQTVVDKINYYSDITGLVATTDGTDITATSAEYGASQDYTIYSDLAFAADGSMSGFQSDGTSTDTGVDIAGTFTYDGTTYQANGVGAVLTGRSFSPANGLRVYYSGIAGADIATVQVSNQSLTFQLGANSGQTANVSMADMSTRRLGTGLDARFDGANQFKSLAEISLLSSEKASDAIAIIDKAIEDVNGVRGDLGAFQGNTLESGLSNLRIAQENLVAAESVIRDTDMAAEVASFTRGQILVQSASAMLSHANATPNIVLQLLG